MVLAAGAGTRLRPLTYQIPKPMVPVVNRPVIHHVLDNLLKHGVQEVMVNLHALPEQVKGYYVEIKTDAFDRAAEEIIKGEEYGIKMFGS